MLLFRFQSNQVFIEFFHILGILNSLILKSMWFSSLFIRSIIVLIVVFAITHEKSSLWLFKKYVGFVDRLIKKNSATI